MLVVARAGDDQHASVDAEHIHVVAVEAASTRANHLLGRAAGGAAGGEVHDPVHHGQQRVHLVGGDHPAIRCSAPTAPAVRRLLGTAKVQVGQRLVEQQQLRPALTTRAIRIRCCSPPTGVPTAHRRMRASTASTISWTRSRRVRDGAGPRGVPVEPEPIDHVRAGACPGRAGTFCGRNRLVVLLPDRRRRRRGRLPVAGAAGQDDPEQRRLAGAVEHNSPAELAGADLEAHLIEHRPPASRTVTPSTQAPRRPCAEQGQWSRGLRGSQPLGGGATGDGLLERASSRPASTTGSHSRAGIVSYTPTTRYPVLLGLGKERLRKRSVTCWL